MLIEKAFAHPPCYASHSAHPGGLTPNTLAYNECLFPVTKTGSLSEDVVDRATDVLWTYWPTILIVAVTIGIAFFLIAKAMRAVRGKI